MVKFRPLPMLTLMAIAALVVLVMFGRWQWSKYVAESAAQEQPPLEVTLSAYEPLPEGMQLVYGAVGSAPGWRVLTPVRAEGRIVFVDAAFQPGPETPDYRTLRLPGALAHGVAITGVSAPARLGGAFTAAPDPANRIWYEMDLAGMAAAAALEGPVDTDSFIALPYIGEDGRPLPNPFVLGRLDPTPPAQHLGYALTRWGLALALIAVYFAYHVSAGRLRFGRGAG